MSRFPILKQKAQVMSSSFHEKECDFPNSPPSPDSPRKEKMCLRVDETQVFTHFRLKMSEGQLRQSPAADGSSFHRGTQHSCLAPSDSDHTWKPTRGKGNPTEMEQERGRAGGGLHSRPQGCGGELAGNVRCVGAGLAAGIQGPRSSVRSLHPPAAEAASRSL